MSSRQDGLRALQDMFPAVKPSTLNETLQSCNLNVEAAIDVILSKQATCPDPVSKKVHASVKSPARGYSRLQSGAGLISPSRPRPRSAEAAQSQPKINGPGSFARALASGLSSKHEGAHSSSPESHGTSPQCRECFAQHPWLDAPILESVLVACDGDMAKAKGWLIDMDPFVAEGNELPTQLQAMYAEGTSDMQSTEELPDASNDNKSVSSTEDVYWKHRKAAIRLSRQWRKLFRNAISAARGGDHSTHRSLISQAHAVRAEAERAHEDAAGSIEHANNAGQGRGIWELDLHGLHAPEAVEAVNRRLQVLTSIPARSRRNSTLRIIVGRGRHSSDGEASVPPAVLRYLTTYAPQQGWRFAQHGGAFTVSLPSRPISATKWDPAQG